MVVMLLVVMVVPEEVLSRVVLQELLVLPQGAEVAEVVEIVLLHTLVEKAALARSSSLGKKKNGHNENRNSLGYHCSTPVINIAIYRTNQ